jgi:D-sedoheptulose 7-phosphate isomerase
MKKVQINQAVILAGGRGERLRPLTDHLPKPMAPINGTPFLDYLIQSIVDAGIKRILLLLGYKADKVLERYAQGLGNGIQIEFSIGSADDLTGRRLLNAYDLLEDKFLLMYGDNYWPIAIDSMQRLYASKEAKVMTTVFRNQLGTGEYGFSNNVEVAQDAWVKRYDKKRLSQGLNGVDIGYFIVDKDCLDPRKKRNISFEEDILPEFIDEQQLIAYMTDAQYYYITNAQSLKTFERAVEQEKFQPLPKERPEMNFFENFLSDMCGKIRDVDMSVLDAATKLVLEAQRQGGRLFIAGNGGSASIASHVAVDLTKNTDIPASTFNEASLITGFSNDYGYERWLEMALEFHAKSNDILVLISSSGCSPNMTNAARKAKEMGLKLITFTGFTPENPLRTMGDINFWVDSQIYNIVEMTHHIWVLAVVDKLIEDGKPSVAEFSAV